MNTQCELIMQEQDLEMNQSLEHSIKSPPSDFLRAFTQQQTQYKCDSTNQNTIQLNQKTCSPTENNNFSTTNDKITSIRKSQEFSKLIIYYNVIKFANKLISTIKPSNRFGEEQFNIINDKSAFYDQNIKLQKQIKKDLAKKSLKKNYEYQINLRLLYRRFKKRTIDLLEYRYNKIPLIEPNSEKLFIWEVLLNLIRIYLIIWFPIMIVFNLDEIGNNNFILITISSIILLVDIIRKGFTIIYDKGQPLDNRYVLMKRQINFSNLFQIIGVITMFLLSQGFNKSLNKDEINNKEWLKLGFILLLIEIKNLMKFLRNLQLYYKPSKGLSSIIDLSKLMGLILVIQHICACIWLILGQMSQYYQQPSWIDKTLDKNWIGQYLESFYFMSVTMFTVGYGDITPQNSIEKIFCICYMFLSTLQLSYSVNTIGTILTLLKDKDENYRKRMTCINEYLYEKNISQTLQYKIREFCDFCWDQDIIQKKKDQEEIINQLPEDLQQQLKAEQAKYLTNRSQFFKQNFSKNTIQQLIQESVFIAHQPGHIIKINSQQNGIYVIEKGKIEVFLNKTKIQILQELDCFGYQEYLSNQFDNKIQYKTQTYASLLYISYDSLNKLMKKDNNDFERTSIMKKLKQNYCIICKNHSHITNECKLVYFQGDKEKLIKCSQFYSFQTRQSFIRQNRINNYNKTNFNNLKLITQHAQNIQQDLEDQILKIYPQLTFEKILQPTHQNTKGFDSPSNDEIYKPETENFQIESIGLNQLQPYNQGNQVSLTFRNHLFQKQDTNKFEDDFYKDLKLKILNVQKYNQKLQEDLFWIFKIIDNKDHSNNELVNFETIKNYNKYDPMWNINKIIEKVNSYEKYSDACKLIIYKYQKYLLFPLEFIKRFKKQILQQPETNQTKKIRDIQVNPDQQQYYIRKFERRKAVIYPKSFTIN